MYGLRTSTRSARLYKSATKEGPRMKKTLIAAAVAASLLATSAAQAMCILPDGKTRFEGQFTEAKEPPPQSQWGLFADGVDGTAHVLMGAGFCMKLALVGGSGQIYTFSSDGTLTARTVVRVNYETGAIAVTINGTPYIGQTKRSS